MESRNSIISIVLNASCYSIGNFLRPLPTHYQQYRCYCFSLLIICVKRGQLSADYIIVYSATGLNSGWFEYYVLYLVFFYVTSYKSSFCRRYLLLLFMKRSCLFQKVVSLFLWLWFYIKLFFLRKWRHSDTCVFIRWAKGWFWFRFLPLNRRKTKNTEFTSNPEFKNMPTQNSFPLQYIFLTWTSSGKLFDRWKGIENIYMKQFHFQCILFNL